MKGLLVKDFYLICKYCRAFILIIAVFVAVSFVGDGNMFFTFYPCIISGLLPMTLIAYDERDKWDMYAGGLPYTKTQLVSGKYVIGLSMSILVLAVIAIAEAFRMYNTQAFVLSAYLFLLLTLFSISLLAPALMLPFVFKFGAEKGRIIYYVIIALACVGSTVFVRTDVASNAGFSSIYAVCAASILLYAVSWILSVYLYKKREI